MILSFLFPKRCPVCDKVRPLSARKEEHFPVCAACYEKLVFVQEPFCKRCGKPLPAPDPEYCFECQKKEVSFHRNYAAMVYNAAAKNSMVLFKYHGRREFADFYVRELLRQHGGALRSLPLQAIIPVPIHRSRLMRRGYNQAALLSEALSKELHVPERRDILFRTKKTIAQKKLGPEARIRNLQDALRAEGDLSGLRHVLLVDDIYTTGSTLEACSRVLTQAGAAHVDCATVCVVENE